jgi:mannose-6-phosphate isomerase
MIGDFMPVTRLTTKRVEKPWGRTGLWPGFPNVQNGDPVGEIWFQLPDAPSDGPELLIKYLFTSQKLSIQVHPDDAAARAAGYPRGKDEAWVILAAEPHATIGLGLRETVTREQLRAAALDGSIEAMLDWKPVKAGDFFYSPAGTVHAIGPGLTLIEVQQNVDLTYRLYDYGSDRELHLDAGIAVSDPVPYVSAHSPQSRGDGRLILADGPKFVLERWSAAGDGRLSPPAGRPLWLIPIAGDGGVGGQRFTAGEAWLVDEATQLALNADADLLVAYPGAGAISDLWTGQRG